MESAQTRADSNDVTSGPTAGQPSSKGAKVDLVTVWQRFATFVRAKARSERGASLVEYALLVALIAVVCIVAISFLGGAASKTFSSVGSNINTP
jgi:pilus assembly protein Flp/PilA